MEIAVVIYVQIHTRVDDLASNLPNNISCGTRIK